MKKLLLFGAMFTVCSSQAQKYKEYDEANKSYALANELKFTIYSIEYKEGKKRIDGFIKKNNISITNQNETKTRIITSFQPALR